MSASTYKPFMAYLSQKDIIKLKRFSKQHKVPMAQIIRESVAARLTPGDQFSAGFNSGIHACIDAVQAMNVAQMRFPSGRTFAEVIKDELEKKIIVEAQSETERTA
jgi:hypothetical protein